MTKGPDISSWQGAPDFDKLKANCDFIFVKSSEGIGFTDPQFKRNQLEARNAGIPLGYYHFARPDLGNDPAKEADWFLTVVGSPKEGEVYCLDFEVTYADTVNWCQKFMERIRFMLNGYNPLIYLNQSQVNSFNWKPIASQNFGLWIAAYTYDPNNNNFVTGAWDFAAMQQYSNNQAFPGINGGVDANVFFGDIIAFKNYGYKKPAPLPEPLPVPSPLPTPVPTPLPIPTPTPIPVPTPTPDPIDPDVPDYKEFSLTVKNIVYRNSPWSWIQPRLKKLIISMRI